MTDAGAPIDVRASVRGGPIRWLVIGGLFLIAAITIGTTIMAGNFRDRALNSSKRELENTVMLLARHFDQQFSDFGAIQQDLVTFIQSAGINSTESFKRRMSSADINAMLKAKIGALSYVGAVNLFDSDGMLINSSNAWPVPLVSVADRTYFKTFKTDPKSPDTLVEPVHSRITGVWTTVIARKITGPNGEFLGAIGRGFEPANFEKFFASMALGKDATVSMVHRNGTLLARFPHNDALTGETFNGSLMQRVQSQGGTISGLFTRPSDGEERLGAASALNGLPLVILGSTSVAAVLTDWREQMRFLIAVGAVSVFVIAILLFLVVRRLSLEHRLSQQRLRLEKLRLDRAINNMTQGLLLFDVSERLVVCNQRYIEMYGLSPHVIKPGCSFRDVIAPTGSKSTSSRRRMDAGFRSSMSRSWTAAGSPPTRTSPSAGAPNSASPTSPTMTR